MNKRIVVAVDGPAGSGKSTVSRTVACDLGMKYIDSGALYRSITWYALSRHEDLAVLDEAEFLAELEMITLSQTFLPDGTSRSFIDGKDITDLIREERIAKNIGRISDRVAIRNRVNVFLHAWAARESVIMDGRDIGSVVFPDAELKFYLDASVDVRAGRRVKEYMDRGKNVDEIAIKNQIMRRDQEDMDRPFGALKRSEDAIYIDTSSMVFMDVVRRLESIIKEKYK